MAGFVDSRNNANFRVGGSAFTVFAWGGKILARARGISDQSPRPITQPVAIQPMDQRYPMAVITPAALGPGTLTIRRFETYGSRVWDDLMDAVAPLDNGRRYPDLVSIFIALSAREQPVNAIKIINPPRLAGRRAAPYGDVYLNCVITDIGDNEEVEVGTMDIVKNVTVTYTRKVRTDSGLEGIGDIANAAGFNQSLPDVTTPVLGL